MRKNFILTALLFLFNKKREKKWGIGNLEEMSLKDYFFFFIF